MNRLALLAALAGSIAVPAYAAQDPVPGRLDRRLQTVLYNPKQVTRVYASPLISTQIMLHSKEPISAILVGDAEAWLTEPVGTTMVFVKPREIRAPTNMQVITTRADGSLRTTLFELIAKGAPLRPSGSSNQVASLDGTLPQSMIDAMPETPFAIQFLYPDDARQATAEARSKAREGDSERKAEARLAVDYFYGPRNWRYAGQGSHAIEPAEVSDNGRLTAFRFPGNSTVPVIYTIGPDGSESIVPYSMKGDVAVVSTTAREFRLRSGKEVLRVINLAYDARGQNPMTGTTSPDVVRTIRAAVQ